MKTLSTILFDFDGVLSNGRFYHNMPEEYEHIRKGITERIFTKKARPTVHEWMKGLISYEELHEKFAEEIGTTAEFLNRSLEESVKTMPLNSLMLNLATKLRSAGCKTAIFTDNMDIFDRVTVPHFELDKKFDKIFSSSEYGKMKVEILEHAIEELGGIPETTLLIDDCPKIGVDMKQLGGEFYLYDNYEEGHSQFVQWLSETFENSISFLRRQESKAETGSLPSQG